MTEPTLPKSVKRGFGLVVAVAVGIFAVMAWQITKNSDLTKSSRALAKQGKQAHDAICEIRLNLSHRISTSTIQAENSRAYLKAHPEGLPALHVTAEQIRKSLADQEKSLADDTATYDALSKVVDCTPPVPPPIKPDP